MKYEKLIQKRILSFGEKIKTFWVNDKIFLEEDKKGFYIRRKGNEAEELGWLK